MTSPNPPAWAPCLWIEANTIHMDLPAIGHLHSHRLTFPNDAIGMTRALYLIQQRTKQSVIAEEGDITQHQLDRKIRNMKANLKVDASGERVTKAKPKERFAPAMRSAARDVMRRLGL